MKKLYFTLFTPVQESIKTRTNLGSNFGRQIGIQFSLVLRDSVALTRLKRRWRSAGWSRNFFMRTREISWFWQIISPNTRFCSTEDKLFILSVPIIRITFHILPSSAGYRFKERRESLIKIVWLEYSVTTNTKTIIFVHCVCGWSDESVEVRGLEMVLTGELWSTLNLMFATHLYFWTVLDDSLCDCFSDGGGKR